MNEWEQVKERIDFRQYVERHTKVNGQKKALCLFHPDTSPSMHIYADSYHCFTCGATGDIFDFAMKYHGIDKHEALIELAREAGVTLEPLSVEHQAKQDKRARIYEINAMACAFYEKWLFAPHGRLALRYLIEERKLSLETIKTAHLGFAPASGIFLDGTTDDEMIAAGLFSKNENGGDPYQVFWSRLMVPMMDHKGRVVGFSGRALLTKQEPKYKNTPETDIFKKGHLIYTPTFRAKNGHHEALHTLVVVEGHMDALNALNRGFTNVVAQMGTAFTDEQLTLLLNTGAKRLVFCLDNDQAGMKALHALVSKHLHVAAERGVDLYAMQSPHGKDPDDCFRERPELWQPAAAAARPVVDVLIERETPSPGASTTQKIESAKKLMPILKGSNGLVTHDNLDKLSRALGYPVDVMNGWLRAQVSVMPRSSTPAPHAPLNVTETELKVLHGVLVNDDDRWLDRANGNLMRVGEYPRALQALSMNDFSSKPARDLMACIVQGAKGERPFDAYVFENVGSGPLHEVYQRAVYRPAIESIIHQNTALAYQPLEYSDFLKAVVRLRYMRLERDITCHLITGNDLVEWCQARRVLGDYL